jgi:hypothetical protein
MGTLEEISSSPDFLPQPLKNAKKSRNAAATGMLTACCMGGAIVSRGFSLWEPLKKR